MEGYWASWEAQLHRHFGRVVSARRFVFDGEPIQKKPRVTRRTREIRDQVAADSREHRRAAFTGPVALSIHFTVTLKQPPDVTRLAKYLLDVLGKDKTGRHRGPTVYLDDRQVKMLHVSWSHATEFGSGRTDVVVRPLRDVVAELRLSQRIRLERTDESVDGPFAQIDQTDENDVVDEDYLPDTVKDWLRRFDRSRHQEPILQRTSAHLRSLLVSTPERIAGARPSPRSEQVTEFVPDLWLDMQKTDDESWNLLMSEPFTVPMPALPTKEGETAEFRQAVYAGIARFAVAWSSMVPLEAPLSVTALVVPPREGKDLDNLAMAVLPAMRDTFRPDAPSALAIEAYQVLQLARRDGDPAAGRLRVVLGSGSRSDSDWEWISDDNGAQLKQLVDR